MIPKKIQPYFKTTHQTKDGDNSIIEGILTCCNAHDFEVFVVGEIKHSMFSKMCLFPENDKTVIFSKRIFAHNVDFAVFGHYPLCLAGFMGYNFKDRKLDWRKV